MQFHGRKVLALAAYLAMNMQPQSRDHLATLFWPEFSQSKARANLRRELSRLRSILSHDVLSIDREQASLNRDKDTWLDVAAFQAHIADSRRHAHPPGVICDSCLGHMESAVNLYAADFLAGFGLSDSPEFDEWQFYHAETLHQALANALERLATGYGVREQYELAIAYARRWLTLDLLDEAAHRLLMELNARAGQRAAALRQYEECERSLQRELQLLPAEETQQLYEAIRTGRFLAERPASPKSAQGPAISLPRFLEEQSSTTTQSSVFVERIREIAELRAALETVNGGRGQIRFVIGGAGRGKTMLVHEFANIAQQTVPSLLIANGHGNAYTGIGDPYLPFREALAMLSGDAEAQWASGSISTQTARGLWEAIPITVPALIEHAPNLIGTFVPVGPLQNHASNHARLDAHWYQQLSKRKYDDSRLPLEERPLFAQYTAVLKAIAAQRPILLILEDLHWIDVASTGLLFHLSREIGNSPVLVVGTYRPDELTHEGQTRHPLLSITAELKRRHGDIFLDLGQPSTEESRRFVDAYLDTQPNQLGKDFRVAFFQLTGGHPLFAVELLREMQERGDIYTDANGNWVVSSKVDWQTLPAKVEGVIEKRLEHLEDGLQAILAVASVEGEAFTAEVLAYVLRRPEGELVQLLSQELERRRRLVTTAELSQSGSQRLSRYRFRHHLYQHYLYHRLDVSERAYLHEGVGNALESLYGEQTNLVAIQLAHHYEQAGVPTKAVTFLLQAGEHAQRLSANQEAIQHLTRGLSLLSGSPDTVQRERRELSYQICLGHALSAMKGRDAPETGSAYKRAHELGLRVGSPHQRFAASHGLYAYHLSRLELQTARTVTQQLLHQAEDQQDISLRVSAHRALGSSLFHLGEFDAARDQTEQGIRLYRPEHSPSYIRLCGQDDGVVSLALLSWTLWFLGYPDQAVQRGREAVAQAQKLDHAMTQSLALMYLVQVHLLRKEGQIAIQHAEALIDLAADQGLTARGVQGTILRDLALISQDKEEGVVKIQHQLDTSRAVGFELFKTLYLAGLTEWCVKSGETEQGLMLVSEGLSIADMSHNRIWESEMYRLKGELIARDRPRGRQAHTAGFAEAEACYRKGIGIARQQRAKSLELRATTSLSRLLLEHGKQAEAHAYLSAIYGWFTEGFDTSDLLEAKALLNFLSD